MNPLIPTVWDVALGVASFGSCVLAVVAFVSVLRSGLKGWTAVLWALFALCVPVIGAVAWFTSAERNARLRAPKRATEADLRA